MTETTPLAEAIDRIAALAPTPTPPIELIEVDHGNGGKALIGHRPAGWEEVYIVTRNEDPEERPDYPAGTLTAHDLTSFVTLVGKHGTPEAEIYAEEGTGQIVAVLDNGKPWADAVTEQERAAWGDHRVTLTLPVDADWLAWLAIDGKLLSQAEFAEHLETFRHTIAEPDAATVLEIAQSIEVMSTARFKSGARNQSGQRTLVIEGQESATAGRDGTLTIPNEITLSLRPYRDSGRQRITALLRYRNDGGRLLLGVRLLQVDDVRQAAWRDVVDELETNIHELSDELITALVVNGTAPRARR